MEDSSRSSTTNVSCNWQNIEHLTSETGNETGNEHGKKRECAQNVFIFPLTSSLHKEIQKERTTHIR